MSAPLRLQALVLPVGEVPPVEKLYRWALGMKPAEEEGALGWGSEDQVRLEAARAARAAGAPEPEEAVVLRMPGMPLAEAAAWLAERDLVPVAAAVPPADEAAARDAWPGAAIERLESPELANRVIVSVRGPAPPRIDLFFPVPRETVVARGGMGPFLWRSGDKKGLEIPGLLGVTTGAPDPEAQRVFLTGLGLTEMEPGGPLAIGDHQWLVEERDPPGIYGWAAAVSDAKVKDLARTMGHLGADYRLDGNRLVAADPAGRVILVHGVRSA
ncbi:MAG TPA: hypothetical protein VM778_02330 [Gemmatimonadota bacterium]|nr:hypothetical protein [Gemmatimonadota bacterium]